MFTSRLKQLRKEAGLTQRNIADVFRTSPQSYAQWEKGLRSPSKESIEKLADFFKVSTDYLLGNSDIKKPTEKSEIELLIEQLSDEQKKETLQFIRNILQ
ncbi:helix-turn-helix domain-containing protein [Streptococcus ruminantium]|uniref:helix-turn-helix domain-containing protein n=1 Tax=Streptococcus ruminantium TaxID=1917441 RepID=UPI0012DEC01D|nr:helix-turn-helix transcriptional regulator [Streptococcus ruminantium]